VKCGRVPHVCPRNIMTMIRTHPSTEKCPQHAQPSARRNLRNEKVILTTLITKLLTNPLTRSRS
jgi:hypothetical protein